MLDLINIEKTENHFKLLKVKQPLLYLMMMEQLNMHFRLEIHLQERLFIIV